MSLDKKSKEVLKKAMESGKSHAQAAKDLTNAGYPYSIGSISRLCKENDIESDGRRIRTRLGLPNKTKRRSKKKRRSSKPNLSSSSLLITIEDIVSSNLSEETKTNLLTKIVGM